ncbi:Hypothetical predicted protein [Paramuricea clavata]|uniref:Uncharacterized protein n=1 Tax=Paramuricea clavata TaxID=317549 RepID=A0A7D9H7G9_PARCT|nr:Hypothetical predicted protein [Paramuricea clavata]
MRTVADSDSATSESDVENSYNTDNEVKIDSASESDSDNVDDTSSEVVVIAIFSINKVQFVGSDSIGIMINDPSVIVHTGETFMYSSLWNIRANFSTRNREDRVKALSLLLILMCGDIETCPGPIRCSSCEKSIRRTQSSIKCNDCQREFHLKCFGESNKDGVCLRCNMASTEFDTQTGRGLLDLPILHEIHMFTLSETHLNEENSHYILADISEFKLAYRNRPNGTLGGVAAFISDRVQWIRRHDLEHPELECLWIEVLIKNAKSILVGTIYKPPAGSKFLSKDFPDYFDDMLSTVAAENKELILMGDLNCNCIKKKQ